MRTTLRLVPPAMARAMALATAATFATAALPGNVAAQPVPVDSPDGKPDKADKPDKPLDRKEKKRREQQALKLYQKGTEHYDKAEYDEAIEAFKEAYSLYPDAVGFNFNIAQSYRLKGDCEQALKYYEDYLRLDPEAQNKDVVEGNIAEMKACVAKKNAKPIEVVPDPDEGKEKVLPDPEPVDPEPPADDGGGLRLAGLVIGGVGVAALGAGVGFGLDARKVDARLSELSSQPGGFVWCDEHDAVQRRGKRSNTLMIALTATGGAAIVTGGVLYFLGLPSGGETKVSAAPLPGGGAFVLSGKF